MKYLNTCFFTLCLSLFVFPANSQTIKTYTESTADFVNPERGMYRYFETRTAGGYSALSQSALETLRTQDQQSLIYRIFYLDAFYNDPISTAVLEAIEQDFASMRAAGVKALVRFAYSDELEYDEDDNPVTPFNDTPDPSLVFQHIHQLRPVLRANSDVILSVHNGFYGIWGENYYSDDFGTSYPGPITAQQQARRDAVTDSLLAILPEDRSVSVRYPTLKSIFLNVQIPDDSLTSATAFQGTAKSRIGYHNDCFLADYNDYTFLDTLTEKPYWATESQYVLMGGESCRDEPTYTQCSNALSELERFHWTYLNDYYHPDVLQRWQNEGCFAEVRQKLGYRLVLREAILPDLLEPGQEFSLSLTIENVAWAAPMLPRGMELILRHTSTQEEFSIVLEEIDLRRCGSGQTHIYNLDLLAGNDIPPGNYALLLYLPDGRTSLHDDPKFAIRLANTGLWETASGMNDLQHTLVVQPPACPVDTTLSEAALVSGTYRASNELTIATDVAGGADVRFEAGNLIRMLPGFIALQGSTVTAVIQDCDVGSLISERPPAATLPADSPGIRTHLRIWPNPSGGLVQVQYETETATALTAILMDGYGRPLQRVVLRPGEITQLDLQHLPRGIYLLHWNEGGMHRSQKLIRN